ERRAEIGGPPLALRPLRMSRRAALGWALAAIAFEPRALAATGASAIVGGEPDADDATAVALVDRSGALHGRRAGLHHRGSGHRPAGGSARRCRTLGRRRCTGVRGRL